MIRYELEHQGTELGTGWFAPVPAEPMNFDDGLNALKAYPYDEYLHKVLLHMAGTFGPNLTQHLIQEASREADFHLLALMYETCVLNPRLQGLAGRFQGVSVDRLADYTPLIYIKWSRRHNPEATDYWIRILSDNLLRHNTMPPPEQWEYPIPVETSALEKWENQVVSIKDMPLGGPPGALDRKEDRIPAEQTCRRVLARLERLGVPLGRLTQHPAGFSPFSLQMSWPFHVCVNMGRNHYELCGLQTSYGKGLAPEAARVSCLMEVAERISSWASFQKDRALCYKHGHTLVHGRFQEVNTAASPALNPNELRLEVPYNNEPLYWIRGHRRGPSGTHSILLPAQLVFLFCNLDEICLTSGLSSTGLAAGNTLDQAKLHALLEVIERDAERLIPFVPERCFMLEPKGPGVRGLLDRAQAQSVAVQFLDLTTEFGVPCYKAFLQGPNGNVLKGCAAHLNGARAAVSALLELPYHASWFRPAPCPKGLKTLRPSDLPNYSTGSTSGDLERLERLLIENGFYPVYVDLTRSDLDIPVVKALVPGLEMSAELDPFSSLSLRQFAHFVKPSLDKRGWAF
ncbi:MAG: YcaO-like family protein [Deltaproteobacteria bacterium]|nr:YcaO-like family protein [Deltaproteobacteria bacterium]